MRTGDKTRQALAALYSRTGADIPAHLLPPTDENEYHRYEAEKRALPPMPPEEYDKAIKEIVDRLGI